MKIKPVSAKDRLIVALLAESMNQAKRLVRTLKNDVDIFEVGMPTYTILGPDVIKMIHNEGCRVFLDLKYHDIPSTVAKAVEAAAKLNVFMLNVHASGGSEMLKLSVAAAAKASKGREFVPRLVGVTVLTSMNTMADIGIQYEVREQVVRLAKLSQKCGLDGVVASPLEIRPIRNACGDKFLIITTGVRPLGTEPQDQRRIASPVMAIAAGADYIVVGRPVIQAKHPIEVVRQIIKEIS